MMEQKTFNFTNVNAESNAQLIKDLELSIAKIGHIPNELVNSISAIKQRLELYQGFKDYQKEVGYLPEYRPLAKVVLKNGCFVTIDFLEEGHVHIDDIVKCFENAFEECDTTIEFSSSCILTKDVDYILYEGKKVFDHIDQSPFIASITLKDGTVLPLDKLSSGNITFDDVVNVIKEGIKKDLVDVNFGGTLIPLDLVYEVKGARELERMIVNENNKPDYKVISEETILKMNENELMDTYYTVSERISNANYIDDIDSDMMLLDTVVETLHKKAITNKQITAKYKAIFQPMKTIVKENN